MRLQDKLKALGQNGKALLATNFYNFETLKGLLLGAKETNSCMILQLSESSLQYLGIQPAAAMARSLAEIPRSSPLTISDPQWVMVARGTPSFWHHVSCVRTGE